MTEFCVLIRDPNDDCGEKEAMKKLDIPFIEHRSEATELADRTIIIGRYSVLPYYKELETDIANTNNCNLINSYHQFRYIADLGNWYQDFIGLTPKTWFTLQEYLADFWEGPVVLKGETNSRRDKWSTHMFANNKDEAREVYCRLLDDSLISQQKIYIRQYEPLVKLIDGVNGMPIPNEWRIFVCFGKMICADYYWGTYREDIEEKGIKPKSPPMEFIQAIIAKVGNSSNFYCVDLAETAKGDWTIVEFNEGQMSGLNGTSPMLFYTNLRSAFNLVLKNNTWDDIRENGWNAIKK